MSSRSIGAPPVLVGAGYSDCSGGDETATFTEFDDSLSGSGAANHIDWIFVKVTHSHAASQENERK